MNFSSIITAFLLGAGIAAAVVSLRKNSGCSGCCGDCGKCKKNKKTRE